MIAGITTHHIAVLVPSHTAGSPRIERQPAAAQVEGGKLLRAGASLRAIDPAFSSRIWAHTGRLLRIPLLRKRFRELTKVECD
jgi:hypothetical protein